MTLLEALTMQNNILRAPRYLVLDLSSQNVAKPTLLERIMVNLISSAESPRSIRTRA